MLRLLSFAPRAIARTAVVAARTTAVRAAPAAAARTFTHSAQRCAKQPPAQAEQDEVEETQEEEKAPVPFPEAAAGVVSAVATELASFDTADDYAESYTKDHSINVAANVESETLIITRKNQNHEIRITMRAEALEQEEPEEDAKEEEDEDKLPEHKFLIDITNTKGNIMRLECYNSPQGELEVGSMTFPSSVSPDPATVTRADAEKADETAPVALRVDEMEDATSQAFFAYLESLGVDDDLAVFVASQAQIVRTKAQMARLEKFKNFVQQ